MDQPSTDDGHHRIALDRPVLERSVAPFAAELGRVDRGFTLEVEHGDVRRCADFERGKLIRFIENHDEPRAASIFPPEKERAASVMIATLPGAKLFHEGQFDGRKVRLPVFLGRRPAAPIDSDHQAFCRNLLKAVHSSVFGDGNWQLCGRSGWPDNQSYLNLVAWCWKKERDRYFIVFNLSDQRSQGRVRLPWEELPGQSWSLTDVFTEEVYERDGREMCDLGLYIDLEPWRFHFFRF